MKRTILTAIHIGCDYIVAAGTVATKDVSQYAIIFVGPVKVIKMRFIEE